MDYPDITFGLVNCNRLHYFKACLNSLVETVADYPGDIQIIPCDNASIDQEEWIEYVLEVMHSDVARKNNIIVNPYMTGTRDPRNEYARALNHIVEESTSDLLCLTPADVQFVRTNWLSDYAEFYLSHKEIIGCIKIDAQRKQRLENTQLMRENENFWLQPGGYSVGAGCCFYTRDFLKGVGPWSTDNDSHEGGGDSETKMLEQILQHVRYTNGNPHIFQPHIPVAVAIYNDDGTSALVRENKRYGEYSEGFWKGSYYYRIHDPYYRDTLLDRPVSIEEIADCMCWDPPIDRHGNWIKAAHDTGIVAEIR
jgi:hypothetical protein